MDFLRPLDSTTTKKITFGCPTLDRIFGGGIPIGSITEVAGESGTGKTQLMLQLALNAQLPEVLGGQDGNSLFLNAELSFPIKRLHEIASNNPFLGDNPLDKVFVHSIQNIDELLSVVAILDSYLAKSNTKLILLDSIATLFRSDFSCNGADMSRRQQIFFKIAAKFKLFAVKYDLAIVMTNQVVDFIPGSGNLRIGNDPTILSSGRPVVTALGVSWANCVNTRFMVVKTTGEEAHQHQSRHVPCSSKGKSTRRLLVVFAPHLGRPTCDLDINQDGIFGVSES